MNEFSKLNRDQMRKITGGVVPTCNVGEFCYIRIDEDTNTRVIFGVCNDHYASGVSGCICQGENSNLSTSGCLTEVS
jgi:hypothetical protein